jgi:hypothetical protein
MSTALGEYLTKKPIRSAMCKVKLLSDGQLLASAAQMDKDIEALCAEKLYAHYVTERLDGIFEGRENTNGRLNRTTTSTPTEGSRWRYSSVAGVARLNESFINK